MKAWFVGVFVVAGCNQIFGNHTATSFDAPKFDSGLGIDAAETTMSLQYMVLGDPTTPPTLDPPTLIKAPAMVQVGAIPPAVLGAADVQTQDDDGNWAIPLSLRGATFLVRYTPPDGIPVDFYTSHVSAHFVIPSLGRLTPRSPVSNTPPTEQTVVEAFTGGPDGTMGSWSHGRFFEVGGLWAISEQNTCCLGVDKSVLSNWVSLSGPQAVPGAKDTMVLTDAQSDGGSGFLAYGYGTVQAPNGFDSNGNPISPFSTSVWHAPTVKTSLRASPEAVHPYAARAFTVLNDNAAVEDAQFPKISGGVVPSIAVTPVTGPILASGSTAGGLEQVAFLPLAQSPVIPMNFVNPFDGSDAVLPTLPTVVVQRGSETRTFADTSLKVSSGITAIAPATSGATSSVNFGDGVAIATSVELTPITTVQTPQIPLLNADHTSVMTLMGSYSTLALSFAADMSGNLIDDCMITVYRLDTSSITPIHRYLVSSIPTEAAPVLVAKTVFDSASEYTLGISCFHGHPMAASEADWRPVGFPFAASTVYTKSFTVP
jgi:hypothetical protein